MYISLDITGWMMATSQGLLEGFLGKVVSRSAQLEKRKITLPRNQDLAARTLRVRFYY